MKPGIAQYAVDVCGGLGCWVRPESPFNISYIDRLPLFRYLNIHERDTLNTCSLNRNTLSSTPGFKGGSRTGLTPNPATDGAKADSWNGQEEEADDEEEDNGKVMVMAIRYPMP